MPDQYPVNDDEIYEAVNRALAEKEEREWLLRHPGELIRRGHAAEADAVAERVRQRRIAQGANPADAG